MIELGITWAGLSFLLYQNLFNESDQKKIETIFKNVRYGFKDHFPSHVKTQDNEGHTTYVYNLPYGLTDNEKIKQIISKTLCKPVKMTMTNGKLIIKVYKEGLRKFYKYEWLKTKAIPIGYGLDGIIYHDFDKIPHMTIAGATRQGKTVLLKLILAHTISNDPGAEFYILDLKGGLEFNRYRKYSSVKSIASDDESADLLLQSVIKRMDNDMVDFKNKGYNNILNTNINKRTFIIVDEGAELNRGCQKQLSKIARIGGALGYRLIFATQYPTADTLPRQIKQNADAKVSFRLPTEVGSRVAIDEQGAEKLEVPGRAIYRTHVRQEIQVPYITDKEILETLRRFEHDSTEKEGETGGADTITFG